jgi:hypothetical protein
MSDERPRFGRFPQRDDIRPCPPHERRPHDGCPACAALLLRPYRVVRRYRGDRVAQDVEAGGWCQLWRLKSGDVSWPDARQG